MLRVTMACTTPQFSSSRQITAGFYPADTIGPTAVRKSLTEQCPFAGVFECEDDDFAKTGSGQTRGNKVLKRPLFLQGKKRHYGKVRNAIFVPFIYKNDHFAKTGSGQT